MTYPQIGNVGVNPEDDESRGTFLSGFVVRELLRRAERTGARASRSTRTCRATSVPGIAGIDTRALVRRLRDGGSQNGVHLDDPARSGRRGARRARAAALPSLDGRDLVDERHLRASRHAGREADWRGPRRSAARRRARSRYRARRLRLRHQAQHPARARRRRLRRHGRARADHRPRDALALKPDGDLPLERPGRSRAR